MPEIVATSPLSLNIADGATEVVQNNVAGRSPA